MHNDSDVKCLHTSAIPFTISLSISYPLQLLLLQPDTQLWNPSKRDNPISALLWALIACLQPWAPCRVILLHFAEQVSPAHQPDLGRAFTFFSFSLFLGKGGSWIWTLMISPGGSGGILSSTISSMSGSSIKNWKAIFNLYFVFH